MKRIAVEEHFVTRNYLDFLGSHAPGGLAKAAPPAAGGQGPSVSAADRIASLTRMNKIIGIGNDRLAEMDRAGIDMQVLSLSLPGTEIFSPAEGTELSVLVNDEIAALSKEYPGRFACFASLAPQDPKSAADELERAVTRLGFKGAMINSNIQGKYLDDPEFRPLLKKAQDLDVPIYIHPREPSTEMIKPYQEYPALTRALWGFAAEAGLHAVRLIFGGVFDEFPRLKIILGHLGESLPFWVWRLDNQWDHEKKLPGAKQIQRQPGEYLKQNFFITTSGMFWHPALQFAITVMGVERVLFAVDYPYESSEVAVAAIDSLPVDTADRERIYHLNAEKLLRL